MLIRSVYSWWLSNPLLFFSYASTVFCDFIAIFHKTDLTFRGYIVTKVSFQTISQLSWHAFIRRAEEEHLSTAHNRNIGQNKNRHLLHTAVKENSDQKCRVYLQPGHCQTKVLSILG